MRDRAILPGAPIVDLKGLSSLEAFAEASRAIHLDANAQRQILFVLIDR